jgi:hypothetical protein
VTLRDDVMTILDGKIPPHPGSGAGINRDEAEVMEPIGAAATMNARCDCDSGGLVANSFVCVTRIPLNQGPDISERN